MNSVRAKPTIGRRELLLNAVLAFLLMGLGFMLAWNLGIVAVLTSVGATVGHIGYIASVFTVLFANVTRFLLTGGR